MEEKIFEVATKISTPFALISVTYFILYLTYKKIISGKYLSKISGNKSFILFERVLRYLFILSIITLFLGVAAYLLTYFLPKAIRSSFVELTSVNVIEKEAYPILDLKLRNIGSEVAFLNNVEIIVKEKNIKKWDCLFYALPSTWQYSLLLSPRSKETLYNTPVSQVILSNYVDRFFIILGQESDYNDIEYVDYKLGVAVLYNNNQRTSVKEIKVRVRSPPNTYYSNIANGINSPYIYKLFDDKEPNIIGELVSYLSSINDKSVLTSIKDIIDNSGEEYFINMKNIIENEWKYKSFYELDELAELYMRDMYTKCFRAWKKLTGNDYRETIIDSNEHWENIKNQSYNEIVKNSSIKKFPVYQ